MEEKRPGQHPSADRPADDATQASTTRKGAEAGGSPEDERSLIRQAATRGEAQAEAMHKEGFGDHKGTTGFPPPTGEK